jgi:hypothetical protein
MIKLYIKRVINIKETNIMKQLILFIFLMQLGHASTYTLNSILKSADQNNVLSKALQQEGLALSAKNKANTASDPFEIFGEGTRAYPEIGSNGNEYSVGASKKLILGNIQDQERTIKVIRILPNFTKRNKKPINIRKSPKQNSCN